MSLIDQVRGDVKSSKTLFAVWLSLQLAGALGVPVFSNMKHLEYRGKRWGIHVSLDDILIDLREPDLDQAQIKLGVLLLDEAHVYFDGNLMRGPRGRILTALVAQAGKRGLPVIYTSHLTGMVAPKIRELTQLQFKTKTPDEGNTVFVNLRNVREWRDALDEGWAPPPDTWLYLRGARRMHEWYDTNEVIDPFEGESSIGSSKSSKSMMKELDRIIAGRDEVKAVRASDRLEVEEQARLHHAEQMKRLADPRAKVFG